MKKDFTLIELLIVVAILGILAALLIPSAQTAQGKSKLSSSLQHFNQMVDDSLNQISAGDYSGDEKVTLQGYLLNLRNEILYYGQVRSMEELRQKIFFLEDKIKLLEQPDRWKQIALAEPDKRVLEDLKTRLTIMETRMSVLIEERVTEWDVALIVFAILAGLSVLVALIKSLTPFLQNRPAQPKMDIKQQPDQENRP